MRTNQIKTTTSIDKELEPAFSSLEKVPGLFESVAESDDAQEIKGVLNKTLQLCDQAGEVFLAKDQPWLTAWTDIRKASLHCELAQVADNKERDIHTQSAMELIKKVLDCMETYPPSADMTAKLYNGIIGTLFRIRSFFDEEEQLEAIDAFIKGIAENMGEAMAADLSLRVEANDLEFAAGMLEAMADLEEDPKEKAEMLKSSQDLSNQAAENLILSGTQKTPREEK